MSNVEVTVQIVLKPTNRTASSSAEVADDGSFHLILKDAHCDIDALEQGVLNTAYPAMRAALTKALEAEGKQRVATDKKKTYA